MKYLIVLMLALSLQPLFAQTTAPTVDLARATLNERFSIMKSKSQTYNEHKVIKEDVLNGVWKVAMDSINAGKVHLQTAAGTISRLETELKNTQAALQQKEASLQDLIYDSTHISVLGISIDKKAFLIIVLVITAALILALGLITGKLKLMYTSVKEKIDLVNSTLYELEDYKRKSLDKQTKLSRELQNERNKLMELRRS